MNDTPITTFEAATSADVSPSALYEVLADLRTHLEWAGKRSPNKRFHLIDLDAPSGPASVGASFSSTGENGNGTFHDRSTVTLADPGSAFAFETDSRLERKHGKELVVHFAHRYEIRPEGTGARVTYSCAVQRANYTPYWLLPFMRPMTRRMVGGYMTRHLRTLAQLAHERAPRP